MWRRIQADGCEWEVRVLACEEDGSDSGHSREDLLEFRCLHEQRPPRRVTIPSGSLSHMTDRELHSTYRRARPIGGDHYGRPGKRMPDVAL